MMTSAPSLRSIAITLSGVNGAARAVDVALELDAVLGDAAQRLEREHLEAARVGEDRTVPRHERVQSADLAHERVARPQMQVVGVGEDHLRARLAQVARVERLHRRQRADRHERRRLDGAVRRGEGAGARGAVGRSAMRKEKGGAMCYTITIASPYE